jgi:hypothetical protein
MSAMGGGLPARQLDATSARTPSGSNQYLVDPVHNRSAFQGRFEPLEKAHDVPGLRVQVFAGLLEGSPDRHQSIDQLLALPGEIENPPTAVGRVRTLSDDI